MTARCPNPVPHSPTFQTARGFTLIELLACVAIIAILLAVLLPALRGARRQGNRMVCLSNLHDLGRGWELYLTANQDSFLRQTWPPTLLPHMPDLVHINYGGRQGSGAVEFGPVGGSPAIPKPLNPHLTSPAVLTDHGQVFRCREDRGDAQDATVAFDYYGTSYWMNPLLVGPPPQLMDPQIFGAQLQDLAATQIFPLLKDLSRSRVTHPSLLLLMGDLGWWYTWTPGGTLKADWHWKAGWHDVVFLDGHAEFLQIRKAKHLDPKYRIIPFSQFDDQVFSLQQEEPSS